MRLEALATALPLPVTFDSRRRKLQRFLSLKPLTFEKIWFPILLAWLKSDFQQNQVLHIAIDRTRNGMCKLVNGEPDLGQESYPHLLRTTPKIGQ